MASGKWALSSPHNCVHVLISQSCPALLQSCPLQEKVRATLIPFLASLLACWGTTPPPPVSVVHLSPGLMPAAAFLVRFAGTWQQGIGHSPEAALFVPRHLSGPSELQSPCQVLVNQLGVLCGTLSCVCVLGSGLHGTSCRLSSSELFGWPLPRLLKKRVELVEAGVEHSRMVCLTGVERGYESTAWWAAALLTVIMGPGFFSEPFLCEVGTPSPIHRNMGAESWASLTGPHD